MRSYVLPVWPLLAAFLVLPACDKDAGSSSDKKGKGARVLSYPVEVTPVEPRPVEYTIQAVGSVEAFEEIQVTTRIAGVIEKVNFTEGQAVKEGAVLAEIEPDRYQLAVKVAQAAKEKAEALAEEAEAGYKRREKVFTEKPGLVSEEELESWRAKSKTSRAEAEQAAHALAQAKLNLRDAFLRAPVAGVIQTRTVTTGQYVQPGTVLATLLRRDPLLLRFKVPETEAARLSVGLPLTFTVGGNQESFSARIVHVAGSAEASTRMVPITAEVDDPKQEVLQPGAFARITIPIGARGDALAIPETAIRPSEKGFLAYVVEGNVARERLITLGMRTQDGLVEVRSGLSPGELLVTRGSEALQDGAQVKIEGQASAPPPATEVAPVSQPVSQPVPGGAQ